MALQQLENIINLFRGSELDEAGKKELVREAMFMTLSRATAADANIAGLEVETVQRILKEKVGEDFSEKDIRVAAIADLYKEATLERYLSKVSSKVDHGDRVLILNALTEVLKADGIVRPFEEDFYNSIIKALGLSDADVAGI